MRRGVARTLSWRTWAKMLRLIRDGLAEGRGDAMARWWYRAVPSLLPGSQGDAWQLGGIVVVLSDGRVPYSYVSSVAGDHPPASDALLALKASAG
jgi:hypothetical protein